MACPRSRQRIPRPQAHNSSRQSLERMFPGLDAQRWRSAAPEAGAQRTLEGVGCSALILIEAPSPAYPGGMLIVGKITL